MKFACAFGFYLVAVAVSSAVVSSQDVGLARRLSSDSQRADAVAQLDRSALPTLMEWTQAPPDGWKEPHARSELYIGMIDGFGRLRAKDAIPFLIERLELTRYGGLEIRPWLKKPDVILNTFPAVSALITIGAESRSALLAAYRRGGLTGTQQEAIVFTLARLGTSPETIALLKSVPRVPNEQLFYWAQEGLSIQENHPFRWKGRPVRR